MSATEWQIRKLDQKFGQVIELIPTVTYANVTYWQNLARGTTVVHRHTGRLAGVIATNGDAGHRVRWNDGGGEIYQALRVTEWEVRP